MDWKRKKDRLLFANVVLFKWDLIRSFKLLSSLKLLVNSRNDLYLLEMIRSDAAELFSIDDFSRFRRSSSELGKQSQ